MIYVDEKQIAEAWEEISRLICEKVDSGLTTQKACKLAIDYCNSKHPSVFDNVCEISEKFSFQRRRYGNTTFTWPIAPQGFRMPSMDPWQASRYPKAILFVDVLQQMFNSNVDLEALIAE